jgi:hypothetical protein
LRIIQTAPVECWISELESIQWMKIQSVNSTSVFSPISITAPDAFYSPFVIIEWRLENIVYANLILVHCDDVWIAGYPRLVSNDAPNEHELISN